MISPGKSYAILLASMFCAGGSVPAWADASGPADGSLTQAGMEELARRSYPYVAMFNVNNKWCAGWIDDRYMLHVR